MHWYGARRTDNTVRHRVTHGAADTHTWLPDYETDSNAFYPGVAYFRIFDA
jgi:hypothetical protein